MRENIYIYKEISKDNQKVSLKVKHKNAKKNSALIGS